MKKWQQIEIGKTRLDFITFYHISPYFCVHLENSTIKRVQITYTF